LQGRTRIRVECRGLVELAQSCGALGALGLTSSGKDKSLVASESNTSFSIKKQE
jgi:hypothetical protein